MEKLEGTTRRSRSCIGFCTGFSESEIKTRRIGHTKTLLLPNELMNAE
jgi:hypothetical protein